jgi:hypothetical protein
MTGEKWGMADMKAGMTAKKQGMTRVVSALK